MAESECSCYYMDYEIPAAAVIEINCQQWLVIVVVEFKNNFTEVRNDLSKLLKTEQITLFNNSSGNFVCFGFEHMPVKHYFTFYFLSTFCTVPLSVPSYLHC